MRQAFASGLGFGRRSGEWRQAIRSLRRTPWYSLTVVSVIALSMALAVATFRIVDGVLFKPLPYPRAGELHQVSGGYSPEVVAAAGQTFVQRSGLGISARDVADLAAAVPTARFTMIAGGSAGRSLGDLRAWSPYVLRVDQHFFDVLGIAPLLGGLESDDFASAGAVQPALLSYATWQRQLGGRADAVGQILTAETGTGAAGRYRVAGVLAPSFLFPNSFAQPDLLTPLVLTEPQRTDRTQRNFQAFVRLPPDVPLADYQARFNDVGRAGRAEIPDTRLNGGLGYWDVWAILPLIERMGAGQRRVFSTIFAAAAVLVLLGCLNVSGLVAARGVDRLRELTLRRALGAGSRDIARLVLAECLALIALGCAIGVALSEPLVRVVLRLLPPNIGLLRDPGLDWRVVGFVAIAASVSTLLVSLWPLRRSLRAQPAGALGGGAATSRSFGRAVVIAAQVAIALVLTLGGALVVASLITVWRTDIGYSTDQLLVVDGTTTVTTPPARVSAVREFVDRVRQIPGVIAAGATQAPMLRSGSPGGEFRADTYQVSAGFFDAVNMPPVEGRLLTRDEIDGGAPVAVVSRTFAAKHLGDGPAVGGSITPPRGTTRYTIVGLVDDARYASWDSQGMQGGQFYRPLTNAPRFTVAIRLGTERDAVLQDVLRLDAADATLRLARAAMAGDLLQETVRPRRFQSWLFGSFSAASLVIVAAGILGLVASTAARRTREVGIRIALGSTGRQVVALLLREQLRPVAAGLAAGGLLSWWAVTYVRSYLYGVTMYDAMVWTIAALVIASVSAIAVLIPALRLSRTDAVQALRVE